MSREILFRGQTRRKGEKVWMDGRPVNGNWVYGGVLRGMGAFSIIYGCDNYDDIRGSTIEKHPVYTDTLGQYIGLTDKNGKKIFEGDVLCFEDSTGRKYYGAVKYGGWNCDCCDGVYGFITEKGLVDMRDYSSSYIAGNIHDNPELLEAQI